MTRKLPSGVYYTRRGGGMYVKWNGRPEGQVWFTLSPAVAHEFDVDEDGQDEDGFSWQPTPYQGADGSCRLAVILLIAAEYAK